MDEEEAASEICIACKHGKEGCYHSQQITVLGKEQFESPLDRFSLFLLFVIFIGIAIITVSLDDVDLVVIVVLLSIYLLQREDIMSNQ